MKSKWLVIPLILVFTSCTKEESNSKIVSERNNEVASQATETTPKIDHDAKYRIQSIPVAALGVYLPTRYIEALEKNRCHQIAMQEIKGTSDALFISKDRVFGSGAYHDGYSFTSDSFKKFNLERISDGLISDDENNEYKKISGFTREYDDTTIKKFIVKVIFRKFVESRIVNSNIEIVDTGVRVHGQTYEIELDSIWEPKSIDHYSSGNDTIGIKMSDTCIEVYQLNPFENDPGYSISNSSILQIEF